MQRNTLVDTLLILLSGLLIFNLVLHNLSTQVYGDDSTLWVHYISSLATSLPWFPNWDACCFAGSPNVGVPFIVLIPSAILVKLGTSPFQALNYGFEFFFMLLGLSVYYFAKKVNAPRLIAIGLPMMVWATNAQWNSAIWGASYDRFFSIPAAFIAIGLIYGLISTKDQDWNLRDYASVIAMLSIVLVSNIHVALFTFVMVGMFMALYSIGTKTIVSGVKKIAAIGGVIAGLTIWYTAPLIQHILDTSGGIALQRDSIPNDLSWIFLAGGQYVSTLNITYVPLLLIAALLVAISIRKGWISLDTPRAILIITSAICLTYYLIEGWAPTLLPSFLLLESTGDLIAPFGFLFIMLLAMLAGALEDRESAFEARYISRYLAAIFLVIIVANAIIATIPITPIDYIPVDNKMQAAICNFDHGCSFQSNYRLAVTGRFLTRWLPVYDPQIQLTEGRTSILDDRPFYTAWFDNVVFYRADVFNTTKFSFEDQPSPSPSYIIDSPSNVASTIFWMDWMGARDGIIVIGQQPSTNTLNIYKASPYLNTTYLGYFDGNMSEFTSTYSGPIAEETNAPVVGFMMTMPDATNQWNLFLASLSYVGLGPSYVIPIQIYPSMLGSVKLNALITDSSSYLNNSKAIDAMAIQGTKVVKTGNDTDLIQALGLGGESFLSQKPSQQTVDMKWTGASGAVSGPLSTRYTGFLWKETYSTTLSLSMGSLSPSFYYAGPGMIYVPITSNGTLSANYQPDYGIGTGYVLASMSAAVLVGMIAVIIERRRMASIEWDW